MHSLSKSVTSNQNGVHKDLILILDRMNKEEYQRPISDFSHLTFEEILNWLSQFSSEQSIILDMGCGVGESSYYLAQNNPTALVIGIDKSVSRLERKTFFKLKTPQNLLILRGELLDLWFLSASQSSRFSQKIEKQYILYPNPWPKSKHIKRRWHANPIAPFIFKINAEIELRSNWQIYTDEFNETAKYFGFQSEINIILPNDPISLFEKKYLESKHDLYQVKVPKKALKCDQGLISY